MTVCTTLTSASCAALFQASIQSRVPQSYEPNSATGFCPSQHPGSTAHDALRHAMAHDALGFATAGEPGVNLPGADGRPAAHLCALADEAEVPHASAPPWPCDLACSPSCRVGMPNDLLEHSAPRTTTDGTSTPSARTTASKASMSASYRVTVRDRRVFRR